MQPEDDEMAPEAPEWLNADFAQRMLRLAEGDSTLQVIDICIKPATAKGDNYASDMMRVTIEVTRKQGDKKINDKKSLIFKFEPLELGIRRDMIEKMQLFDTEISMMTDALKKMNDMVGYESRLGAQVYHVRLERPLCLMMEDLRNLGFRMADRQAGLDLEHTLMAIRGLATFHAASVALCEKEPKHKDIYNKGIFKNNSRDELVDFSMKVCMVFAKEASTWPELDNSYIDKLTAMIPHMLEKGKQTSECRDDEFNVINHGDGWVNNMLFRYDENSKPIQQIFVDFQQCFYGSPAIDLNYFFCTSPTLEVSEKYMDKLHDEYLRTLTDVMERLGCETSPPSISELQKAIEERAFYGVIASFIILPIIMTDKKEVKTINELLSVEHDLDIAGMKNPIYRKIMCKRLPKFVEMGLLDI